MCETETLLAPYTSQGVSCTTSDTFTVVTAMVITVTTMKNVNGSADGFCASMVWDQNGCRD